MTNHKLPEPIEVFLPPKLGNGWKNTKSNDQLVSELIEGFNDLIAYLKDLEGKK